MSTSGNCLYLDCPLDYSPGNPQQNLTPWFLLLERQYHPRLAPITPSQWIYFSAAARPLKPRKGLLVQDTNGLEWEVDIHVDPSDL